MLESLAVNKQSSHRFHGLEVNVEKTKYMLVLITRMQVKITNRSFENLTQLRYLGTTVTNQI
jgi:hypothetical protein